MMRNGEIMGVQSTMPLSGSHHTGLLLIYDSRSLSHSRDRGHISTTWKQIDDGLVTGYLPVGMKCGNLLNVRAKMASHSVLVQVGVWKRQAISDGIFMSKVSLCK